MQLRILVALCCLLLSSCSRQHQESELARTEKPRPTTQTKSAPAGVATASRSREHVEVAQTKPSVLGNRTLRAFNNHEFKVHSNITADVLHFKALESVMYSAKMQRVQDSWTDHASVALHAAAEPEYNAVFTPSKPGSPIRLIAGVPTSIRFYIGSKDPQNVIPANRAGVNPMVLNAAEPEVKLTITAVCSSCIGEATVKQDITYRTAPKTSSEARFVWKFTAPRGTADTPVYVTFDVYRDGLQLDHIVIEAVVESDSQQGVTAASPSSRARDVVALRTVSETQPDLEITVRAGASNTVEIGLNPILPDLENRFAGRHKRSNGRAGDAEIVFFRTAGLTPADVQGLSKATYLKLRALVEQDNKRLQKIVAGSEDVEKLTLTSENLSVTDRTKILDAFYDLGATLYQRLFLDSDDEILSNLLDEVASLQIGRPLRIRIDTSGNIGIPWQLLHVPLVDKKARNTFWGLEYELTVKPSDLRVGGRMPASLDGTGGPLSVMFAKYSGDSPSDPVARLGDMQFGQLQSIFPSAVFTVANSRTQFLDMFKEHRSSIDLISVFTHGSNAWYMTYDTSQVYEKRTTVEDARTVAEGDDAGPRILFRKIEFVTPRDLYSIKVQLATKRAVFLDHRPIVIFDTCESGATGLQPATALDFSSTLLNLGARGVVVTEAPIWMIMGFRFGTELHRALAAGQTVAAAMLSTRKKFLEEEHNPLGLLYAYYGNPSAVLGWSK